MKKNLLIMLFAALLFSCNNTDEKSDAFGNFEADPVIVSSESSGKILQLNIEKGQKIEAGFTAALTDTVQIDLKLKQIDAQKAAILSKKQSIQSQIDVFEEQIKNLETNEKRVAQMVKDQAATQKQLDDITSQISVIKKQIAGTRTQFTSVNMELDVLETQKETAEDLLRRCQVESPVSGTILETYIEQGELATQGKPLFKIADLDELTLKVYVSGAQLPNVKIGQQVNVVIDKSETENQELSGRVNWISSEAEFTPKIIQTKEERVKLVYAVKVKVKNDGTLKVGMPGEISW
ncbi:HlyD family efflux transporter periplasmic adaptor subunit [Maribellus comscasis]|uniref:HlyD family efflux transporter periplasmic adaptor subunit n=1 Tax=Maribellus comscasis TaxID=2681766 RepID=A0A6I6K357_9BACT|nr:HlyD family efflux transporter periplasmic adaptor subunit [Maribellus comscasis]QGY46003.1 HlyD family efflux transporter periplasmic adaptor subunit [Maribellus comscasis]